MAIRYNQWIDTREQGGTQYRVTREGGVPRIQYYPTDDTLRYWERGGQPGYDYRGRTLGEVRRYREGRTYWEDPRRVARYYHTLDNLPPGSDPHPSLDAEQIRTAYEYFQFRNEGVPWQGWNYLDPNDPGRSFLRGIPVPDDELLWEDEADFAGMNWQTPEPADNLEMGGISQEEWDKLPMYQQLVLGVIQNPRTFGAGIGLVAGSVGGLGGMAGGAALGAAIGGWAVKYPKLMDVLMVLDLPKELLERSLGTLSLGYGAAGAAMAAGKPMVGADSAASAIADIMSHLPDAWRAAHLFYETAPVGFGGSEGVYDFYSDWSEGPRAETLGQAAMFEIYGQLKGGRAPEDVYAEWTERMGVSGLARELIGAIVLDPLNVTGLFLTEPLQLMAKMQGNDALRAAMAASRGRPIEAAQLYGTFLRTGNIPGVFEIPDAVRAVQDMSGLERFLAGVDKAGELKLLTQPVAPSRINNIAGTLTTTGIGYALGSGIWSPLGIPLAIAGAAYGKGKGLTGLMGLTPAARAAEVVNYSTTNLGLLLERARYEDDAVTASAKMLRGLANTPDDLARELSMATLNSPEGQVFPKALKDFIKTSDTMATKYHAGDWARQMFEGIAEALDRKPIEVITELSNDVDAEILMSQYMDAVMTHADESVRTSIMEGVESGDLTAKNMQGWAKKFIDGQIPLDKTQYFAELYDALGTHMAKWGAEWFNVEPEPLGIRFANTVKAVQSFVLLGWNWNYFENNAVNNPVTMAASGVLDLRNIGQVDKIWNRVGFSPMRLRAGIGPEAGGSVDVAKVMDPIRSRTIVEGPLNSTENVARKVSNTVGFMTKASAWAEKSASAQAMTAGFLKLWGDLWVPGKGFQQMPNELRTALDGIHPQLANEVEAAIKGGMNRGEIESALSIGQRRRSIDSLIPDVCEQFGMNEGDARSMMMQLGAYDFLSERIAGTSSADEIHKAYQDLYDHAVESILQRQTEELVEDSNRVAQRVMIEGGSAALAELNQVWIDEAVADFGRRYDWARVMGQRHELTPGEFSKLIERQRAIEATRYKMLGNRQEAVYLGVSKAMGLENDAARAVTLELGNKWDVWKGYHQEVGKKWRTFFRTAFDSYESRNVAYETVIAEIDEMYSAAKSEVTQIQTRLDDTFAAMYHPHGDEAVRIAREGLRGSRAVMEEMMQDMQNFIRDLHERDLSLNQRDREWNEHVNFTVKPQIMGRLNENLRWVDELDAFLKGAGEAGEEPGPGPTPGQPPTAEQPTLEEIPTTEQPAYKVPEQPERGEPFPISQQDRTTLQELGHTLDDIRKMTPGDVRAALADARQEAPGPGGQTYEATVPMAMTNDMRRRLREIGYTDESIRNMNPHSARNILGGIPGDDPGAAAAVREVAVRFGIATADDAGDYLPGSDIHTLNAINKYTPEGVKFDRLDDVSVDVAEAAFERRQQVKDAQVAVAERAAAAPVGVWDEIHEWMGPSDDYTQPAEIVEANRDLIVKGRHELPDGLSQVIKEQAEHMLRDFLGGRGDEKRITEEGRHLRGSTNIPWYSDLFERVGKLSRQTVENSLQRIIDDEGRDVPQENWKTLQLIKNEVISQLLEPNTQEGLAAHPGLLMYLGDEEGAARALHTWMTDPDHTISDEMLVRLAGDEQTLDHLFNKMSEIEIELDPELEDMPTAMDVAIEEAQLVDRARANLQRIVVEKARVKALADQWTARAAEPQLLDAGDARDLYKTGLVDYMGYTDDQADGMMQMMDAVARNLARDNDITPAEWWQRAFGGMGEGEGAVDDLAQLLQLPPDEALMRRLDLAEHALREIMEQVVDKKNYKARSEALERVFETNRAIHKTGAGNPVSVNTIFEVYEKVDPPLPYHITDYDSLMGTMERFSATGDLYGGYKFGDIEKLYQAAEAGPIWYSKLTRTVERMPQEKMPADQLAAWLRKQPGIKKDELVWTGFGDWVEEQSGTVTRREALDYLEQNQVRVEEVVRGGADRPDAIRASRYLDEAHEVYSVVRNEAFERLEQAGVSPVDRASMVNSMADYFDEARTTAAFERATQIDPNYDWNRITDTFDEYTRAQSNYDLSKDWDTKYSKYTLPGGEDYKELLLTLPAPSTGRGKIPSWTAYAEYFHLDPINRESFQLYEMDVERNRFPAALTRQFQENYKAGHWTEPNVLAHVRFNDRVDSDGNKVLFLEEIQSDWHQEGRTKGYRAEPREWVEYYVLNETSGNKGKYHPTMEAAQAEIESMPEGYKLRIVEERGIDPLTPSQQQRLKDIDVHYNRLAERRNHVRMSYKQKTGELDQAAYRNLTLRMEELVRERNALNDITRATEEGVPPAPFAKSWDELSMKRMIRWAAERGYDRLAWTTGEQQAARYNLRKLADKIEYAPESGYLTATNKGDLVFRGSVIPEDLPNYVGKENADLLLGQELTPGIELEGLGRQVEPSHILLGEDFVLGGEGMKGFYDRILPYTAKKIGKEWGVKVGEADIELGWEPSENYYIRGGPGEAYIYREADDVVFDGPFASYEIAAASVPQVEISDTVHAIDITPEMRESVMQGMPLFQQAKGAVEFMEDGRAMIRALRNPDISTGIHETAHVIRRWLKPEDIDIAGEWSGASRIEDGTWEWTRPAEEKFARGFERYIAEGVAPTPRLRTIFEKMKQWMLQVYRTIAGTSIDVDLSAEMRSLFDRLFEEDAEIAGAKNFGVTKTGQAEMFGAGEDLPLFSGAAKRGAESTFAPTEQPRTDVMPGFEDAYKPQMKGAIEGGEVEGDWFDTEDGPKRLLQMGEGDPLESPAFRRWFGESKVVDESGEPMLLYHQTKRTSVPGIEDKGFDLEMVGARGSDAGVPDGIFMKSSDVDISVGAYGEEAAQIPMYASIENPLVVQTRYDLKKYLDADPEYWELAYQSYRSDTEGAKIFDEMWERLGEMDRRTARGERNPERDALSAELDEFMKMWKARNREAATAARARATEVLIAQGYDGVIIQKDAGSFNRMTDTYIAFEPTQVKGSYNQGTWDPADPRILYQNADGTIENVPRDGEAPEMMGAPLGTLDQVDGQMPPVNRMTEESWSEQVFPFLRALEDAHTSDDARLPGGPMMEMLDENTARSLKGHLHNVYGQMGDTKLAAIRWAENRRDAALHNYQKRTGMDGFVTAMLPYQLWYTRSIAQWLLRAVDRPAWFANYARLRNIPNKIQAAPGFPSRLLGKMKIPMPFLPEWAQGTGYVDPWHQLFPIEQLSRVWDERQEEKRQVDRQAAYVIQGWLADEEITIDDARRASSEQAGPLWEKAVAAARIRVEGEESNPFDFIEVLTGYSLPLSLLGKWGKGQADEIPQLPITRTIQAATAGVKPGGVNIEAGLRRMLGMPERGQMGEYYVIRELGNMVLDEGMPLDVALESMVNRQGDAWNQALDRAGKYQAMRTWGAALWLDFFPEGEEKQRVLQQVFQEAIESEDPDSMRKFWDKYPEYEARMLGHKWDDPEAMMKQYMVGQVWDQYLEADELTQQAARERFGDLFGDAFLNKETRSYDSIPIEYLVQWNKTLKGEVPADAGPGGLGQTALVEREVLDAYGSFEEARGKQFNYDKIKQLQGIYSNLDEMDKDRFKEAFPQMEGYWNFKNQYLAGAPELIPAMGTERIQGADPRIQQLYYEYITEKEKWFPDIGDKWFLYFSYPAGSKERENYWKNNPELEDYSDWKNMVEERFPGLMPYVGSGSIEDIADELGFYQGEGGLQEGDRYVVPDISGWEPALIRQCMGYYLSEQKLGSGARGMLRDVWKQLGKPGDDFSDWLDHHLVESFK